MSRPTPTELIFTCSIMICTSKKRKKAGVCDASQERKYPGTLDPVLQTLLLHEREVLILFQLPKDNFKMCKVLFCTSTPAGQQKVNDTLIWFYKTT